MREDPELDKNTLQKMIQISCKAEVLSNDLPMDGSGEYGVLF